MLTDHPPCILPAAPASERKHKLVSCVRVSEPLTIQSATILLRDTPAVGINRPVRHEQVIGKFRKLSVPYKARSKTITGAFIGITMLRVCRSSINCASARDRVARGPFKTTKWDPDNFGDPKSINPKWSPTGHALEAESQSRKVTQRRTSTLSSSVSPPGPSRQNIRISESIWSSSSCNARCRCSKVVICALPGNLISQDRGIPA